MKVEHYLTPYTKINLKWIKHLNIRPDTIKFLEENIGRMLFDINHSNILFDPPPRIMTIKTKINQWDLIKLKSFCPADTSFKISQEHCLFLLALFISIMFISFWQNIYFIFYYYQFPPLIYTLRKKDLFLFWSATCALEKTKKIMLAFKAQKMLLGWSLHFPTSAASKWCHLVSQYI